MMGSELANAQPRLNTVDFEDLPTLQASQEKPVLVFLTADWWRYCKNVEQTSFRDPEIVKQLNEEFYVVIFDIESRKSIEFKGQEYRYKSTGLNTGVHELAEKIGMIEGVLNTPTFVVIDAAMNIVFQYGGYMDSQQILQLITAVNS
ncbi:MAG: thioredoxin family protein [Balneolaceae bacterium]|nr:thioredoxin family protein [Balneolaceae bacterium]